MSRRRSSLFLHVSTDPNPDAYPTLWEHRLRQRRPLSRNPFEPDKPIPSFEDTSAERPSLAHQATGSDTGQLNKEVKESSSEDIRSENKNLDVVWGEQAPEWLNLFYDLAWTATFASLTSNNKFKAPWDSVTYVVFFTIAWWIWTSQVFYSIDFYTDDWFHLFVVFLQLIIFGALAAVTRGIDVSDYILHSPDSVEWEPQDLETVTPEIYSANRVTKLSFEAIALVVAFSRLLLLVQHIRVVIYAKFTSRSQRFPLRLLLVPLSLAISTALFFVAFVITRRHGTEPGGAKVKFYLWLAGILVEVIAHIIRFQWDINDGIRLRSHGSIVSRFCGITTIIAGEGINAIAGTFYAIEKAPGFGGPTGAGIVCCGFIVFFLVYLYFEGAAPLKPIRRRAAWAMVHLPWLLGTILLLEGVKNQLLLSSFWTSANYLLDKAYDTFYVMEFTDMTAVNNTLRPLLLSAGTTLDEQYQRLVDMQDQNMTASNITELTQDASNEIFDIWYNRICMLSIQNLYITFMDNDTITDDIHISITQYLTNYTYTYQDYVTGNLLLQEIIWELIKSTVTNGRYIMALSGLTFISLATMNLIQSWPRDRFQWASIISRYAMGVVMSMLLLLNVGKQQYYSPDGDSDFTRAAVFNWIDANWVLPTIALAYGIQFIIDTALVYAAVWYSRRSRLSLVKASSTT